MEATCIRTGGTTLKKESYSGVALFFYALL